MSYSTTISYNDAASLNFDPDLVEISFGALELKANGGLYTTVPQFITSQNQIMVSAISSFTQTVNQPTGTSVRFQLVINAVAYWYNTAALKWEAVDLPQIAVPTQVNTAVQINSNASTLFTDLSIIETRFVGVNVILATTDNSVTPTIGGNIIGYTWVNGNPTTINQCLIYANLSDLVGNLPAISATKPISLIVGSTAAFLHGSKFIVPFSQSVDFDSNGYAQISVIETQTPGIELTFSFSYYNGRSIVNELLFNAIVPNTSTLGINSITTVNPFNFG